MAEEQTVQVKVPKNMDPQKLLQLVQNYEQRQASNKAYRDARNKAVKALIEAHKPEYDELMAQFSPSKK